LIPREALPKTSHEILARTLRRRRHSRGRETQAGDFFGVLVGMTFTLDQDMEIGSRPINRLRTERAAPGQFARFEGFEE
jgi:hypothetical protein